MPITNKDGTPYRLSTPNKLTLEQVVWGPEDKLILHNCKWKSEQTVLSEQEVVPIKTNLKVRPVVIKPKDEPVPEPTFMQPVVEPEPVVEPDPSPPQPEEPRPKSKINPDNIVIFHCQPITLRESQDDLYGDKFKKAVMGKKFTFEGLVVENIDIAMTFWTNIDIPKNSVVFAVKYRTGKKYGEYRWWKVMDSEPRANGIIYKAIPSDYTPSFSD